MSQIVCEMGWDVRNKVPIGGCGNGSTNDVNCWFSLKYTVTPLCSPNIVEHPSIPENLIREKVILISFFKCSSNHCQFWSVCLVSRFIQHDGELLWIPYFLKCLILHVFTDDSNIFFSLGSRRCRSPKGHGYLGVLVARDPFWREVTSLPTRTLSVSTWKFTNHVHNIWEYAQNFKILIPHPPQ